MNGSGKIKKELTKSSFLTSRQSMFLLFILLLLAALFAFYFLHLVTEKKTYLIQRNFRQLKIVSMNIQDRVLALTNVIKSAGEKQDSAYSIKEFFQRQFSERDISDVYINEKSEQDKPGFQFRAKGNNLILDVRGFAGKYFITISTRRISRQLDANKKPEPFDELFFANSPGNIIVLPSSGLLSVTKLDKLTKFESTKDTGGFADFSGRDAVVTFSSGGEEFLLFIHPIQFTGQENLNEKDKWTVSGIMRADKFYSESSRAVPDNSIMVFSLICILIIISWPLLKLRFMSRFGRFRSVDLVMILISFMFASAIMTIIILNAITSFKLSNDVDDQLEKISQNIQNKFISEINDARSELDNISKRLNISHQGRRTKVFSVNQLKPYEPKFHLFDLIHWSDNSGRQRYKLFQRYPTPFINIGSREYFKRAVDNKLWPGGYFLEPIISFTTGDYSVALSKKVDTLVGVIEFLPVSLYEPVLPRGFSYCVIDDRGQVLFHSNPDRNKVEIISDECDNPQIIQAAVRTRSEEIFTASYWGRENRFNISPIKNIPWFTVVMFDKELLAENNIEMISSALFVYCLYILPFLALLLGMLLLKESGRNWFWPQVDKINVYRRLLSCYKWMSALLLLVYILISDKTLLFLAAWLFPHSALVLSGIVVVLRLLKQNYNKDKYLRRKSLRFALAVILTDVLIVLLIALYNWLNSKEVWAFIFVWAVTSILSCFLILSVEDFPLEIKESLPARKHFVIHEADNFRAAARVYSKVLTALLILCSVIPSIGFYKVSYLSQIRSYVKQSQLDYYDKLQYREQNIDALYIPQKYDNFFFLRNERKKDSSDIYLSEFYNMNTLKNMKTMKNKGHLIPEEISWYEFVVVHSLIPKFTRGGQINKTLVGESDFIWYRDNDNDHLIMRGPGIKGKDTAYFTAGIPPLNESFINSEVPASVPLRVIVLLLIITGGIYLLFILMRFAVRGAFIADADDISRCMAFSSFNNNFSSNILLLTKKQESIIAHILKIRKAYVIDIPAQIMDNCLRENVSVISCPVIILRGFEFHYSDYLTNRKKLELAEYLVYTLNKTVIILSSVNPLGGFQYVEEKNDAQAETEVWNRWKDLMAGFIYMSPDIRRPPLNPPLKKSAKRISMYKFIKSLFKNPHNSALLLYNEFGNKAVEFFHPELLEIAQDKELQSISYNKVFTVMLQRTRTYHQALWESCSRDEKLVLVRLIEDRFVSVRSTKTVEVLLRRGLVKRDPNLKPFNTFFARFITEANLYAETYWREQESKSAWGQFRTPFFVLLLGFVVFLFTTQRNLFDSTLAVITGTATFIPAMLNLLASIKRKEPIKKESD